MNGVVPSFNAQHIQEMHILVLNLIGELVAGHYAAAQNEESRWALTANYQLPPTLKETHHE